MTNPDTASVPTAALLNEIIHSAYRPYGEASDPRPLPLSETVLQGVGEAFDAIGHLFSDTRLEDDLAEVLWGMTNVFHRRVQRLDLALDRNELAQRESMASQNGSEVRSSELEDLTAEGQTLVEQRNAFEYIRDVAAEQYAAQTGSFWKPATGSSVNRKTVTASMLDARDFLSARNTADTLVHAPSGPLVAFASGTDYQDYDKIYMALDKAHAKHPTMVLAHGGSDKGGERIAACWARDRKVPQVMFKPDFKRHGNAAPFKRNDKLLEALPIGLIAAPGGGVRDNMVDKAKKQGVPVIELP